MRKRVLKFFSIHCQVMKNLSLISRPTHPKRIKGAFRVHLGCFKDAFI